MAPYRFPLLKILEHRKMLYDQAVWQFAPLANEWRKLEQEQILVEQEGESYFNKGYQGLSVQEVYLRERYHASMNLKKRWLEKEQEKLRPDYLKEREKVLKAFRNLDFMEKLAKSSFDAYKRRVKRKEKNQLDDMTIMRYVGWGGN